MRFATLIFLAFLSLAACKKSFDSNAKLQPAPETFMVVDHIARSGESRFTTTIDAHWWGYSDGGIITGYEVSTDSMRTWTSTQKQSGTFLLAIPPGKDTADVVVYVRAIDNLGQKDLTPASTAYPIKNTQPQIAFDYSFGRKSTTFPAFRLNWSVADTDGTEDITTIDISFNDTTHIYSLAGNTTSITLVDDPSFGGNFAVYQNIKTTPLPALLTGIVYDQSNTIYLRASDRAGSKSAWVKDSIFIRKPKSDVLLINDYTSFKAQPFNFYQASLAASGIPVNIQESVSSVYDELPSDVFTIKKVFGYFRRIVWFSNNPDATLAFAQQNTVDFFANNGRMLLVVDMGGAYPYNASTLSFTPVASFVPPPSGQDFRMAPGDTLQPLKPGWPLLLGSGSVLNQSLRPFNMQASSGLYDYDSLYSAHLTLLGGSGPPTPFTGNSLMIAKRTPAGASKANLVFSSVPIHLMNGNSNADSLFHRLTVDELGF